MGPPATVTEPEYSPNPSLCQWPGSASDSDRHRDGDSESDSESAAASGRRPPGLPASGGCRSAHWHASPAGTVRSVAGAARRLRMAPHTPSQHKFLKWRMLQLWLQSSFEEK